MCMYRKWESAWIYVVPDLEMLIHVVHSNCDLLPQNLDKVSNFKEEFFLKMFIKTGIFLIS